MAPSWVTLHSLSVLSTMVRMTYLKSKFQKNLILRILLPPLQIGHILPLLLGQRTKFLKWPQRWCTGTPITSSSSFSTIFFLLISFPQRTGWYLDCTCWSLLHGFNSPYPFDCSSVIISTGKSSPRRSNPTVIHTALCIFLSCDLSNL